MKKHSSDMLNNLNQAILDADDLLSKLWRIVLKDLAFTSIRWNKRMEEWLDEPRHKIPNTSLARSSARGNLNKEFRDTQMTWKVFEKGVSFLKPVHAQFKLELTWPGGITTQHTIQMPQRHNADELNRIMTQAISKQVPSTLDPKDLHPQPPKIAPTAETVARDMEAALNVQVLQKTPKTRTRKAAS